MIDKECNDEDQQAAAKDFLDWLANTAEGNKVLVDDCSLVPAFSISQKRLQTCWDRVFRDLL